MTQSQRNTELLFELVRCEIWRGEPNTTLFKEEVDWSGVLQLSLEQSLLGIIYNALAKLPKESQPSRDNLFKLHRIVTRNRQQYEYHRQIACEIMESLQLVGVPNAVLIKGINISENYPDPSARTYGDIDILIGNTYYDKAIKVSNGAEDCKEDFKHFEFNYKGIPIELHRFITSSETIVDSGKELVAWLDEALLSGEYTTQMEVDSIQIRVPDATFNAFYIFLHAHHHIIRGGIGLRQICDWVLLLHAKRSEINYKVVQMLLQRHDLTKMWDIFISLAIDHLGLPPTDYPLAYNASKEDVELILNVIIERGNFGQYAQRGVQPKGFLAEQLFKLKYNVNELDFLVKIDRKRGLKTILNVVFGGLKRSVRKAKELNKK